MWIENVTCRDFLRQHLRPRHHIPRLLHSSAKVHIDAFSIHCHNGDHRGVAVVEEHGEVRAADDGGDLGGARAFSGCAVRQPVCRIKVSHYFCMPWLCAFIGVAVHPHKVHFHVQATLHFSKLSHNGRYQSLKALCGSNNTGKPFLFTLTSLVPGL